MKSNSLLQDLDFFVVDTETTGGSAVNDRVIDVAVFHFQGGVIKKKFSSLVNPERPIPAWITGLTGIDDDMVKRAPRFAEIAEQVFNFLGPGIFTAHNAAFDYGFLQNEFQRAGYYFESPQVCTLRLSRQIWPDLPSRSLGHLCESLLIDIWDRHRAHGDAEATVYVLKELLKQMEQHHGVKTWEELQALQTTGLLSLPKGIDYQKFLQLPSKPGLYIFKDKKGVIVGQGKVTNIQRRVKSYFKTTNISEKSERLRKIVHTIEWKLASVFDGTPFKNLQS